MTQTAKAFGHWVSSPQLCETLGFTRRTLARIKASGYFRENHHYRRKNPIREKSDLLWNLDRVMLRMGIEPT